MVGRPKKTMNLGKRKRLATIIGKIGELERIVGDLFICAQLQAIREELSALQIEMTQKKEVVDVSGTGQGAGGVQPE